MIGLGSNAKVLVYTKPIDLCYRIKSTGKTVTG